MCTIFHLFTYNLKYRQNYKSCGHSDTSSGVQATVNNMGSQWKSSICYSSMATTSDSPEHIYV